MKSFTRATHDERPGLNRAREDWAKARRAEIQYGAQLRKIARHVADIIRLFAPDDPERAGLLTAALRRYAEMLDPWARIAARKMVAEVKARSDKQWKAVAAEMGAGLRTMLTREPDDIGLRYAELMGEQVRLIRSIPEDAADRVHRLVTEGLIEGKRFETVAKEIMAGGGVARSKAMLIARTETGRAATVLTQSRAESVGSETFIWRTMRDSDVRPSHRRLEGKVFRWDDPPECDPGHFALPGSIWNCRCYAEPVIPTPEIKSPRRFAAAWAA